MKNPPSHQTIPLDWREAWDVLCDQFEQEWQQGLEPRCEDFLSQVVDEQRGGLLQELLNIELEYSSLLRNQKSLRDYQQRFPQYSDAVAAAWMEVEVPESMQSTNCGSTDELLLQRYDQLRSIALGMIHNERPGHTLQPTALVHEAYLRLAERRHQHQDWESVGKFVSAVTESMRRVLIDMARRRGRLKRGGNLQRQDLDECVLNAGAVEDEVLAVHEGLDRLAIANPSSPLKKAGFQSASGKHHMGGLRCDWSSHRSSGQVQKAETRRQMAR